MTCQRGLHASCLGPFRRLSPGCGSVGRGQEKTSQLDSPDPPFLGLVVLSRPLRIGGCWPPGGALSALLGLLIPMLISPKTPSQTPQDNLACFLDIC